METHENDPTRDRSRDPWNRFSDEFGGLGERLRDTYRKAAAEGGPSEEEVKNAMRTLLGAWDQVADSLSTALQDRQVREKLKAAASSFATAVGTTISELGTEMTDAGRWRPTRTGHDAGEEE